MTRVWGIFFLVIGISYQGLSQHQDPNWSARRAIINEQRLKSDSLCNVLHTLGTFEGHLRTFFMSTINQGDFPDYYAVAMGGGLGYYTPVIKNFQAGMSGFIIYNTSSSHLSSKNSFSNRYELGLFDITNPDNHEDLDRLEDLYLRYYFSVEKNSFIQYGKFHLKTPLVNLQDGRMRPNLQEGVWAELSHWKNVKFKGGWLWRTSPRSTIQWFDMGKSVGIYPNGRATSGAKATYQGQVQTPGLAILNASLNPSKKVNLQLWNYYVPHLFNMFVPKVEWKKKTTNRQLSAALQYFYQNSLYNDTLSIEKQYITKGEKSHSISGRISWQNGVDGNEVSLNYTRITKHGRFLFPREWGVESFYTFMNRERVEGAGDVHAIMLQHITMLDKAHALSIQTSAGMFWMPSVNNAQLNKYTMPNFYQLNIRARYAFDGFWKGLQADLLYMYKGNANDDVEQSALYYHNKVGVHHLSVVLDYYF
jgi:hypothetical protein